MKNKSKKIILVFGITIVLVTLGVVLPIIVKGDNNDAGASQVLSGKTFTNGSAVGIVGTMKNFAGQTPTVTATVEASDEDYMATIDLDDGYYESIQINAKPIYDRGVADGVGNLTRLTSSNFSGTHSSTTAGEASTYTVKSTSAGYVENDTTVASLTAETSPTIATTSATGTQTINVVPGYYNKISVNQTNAYNKGKADGTSGKNTISVSNVTSNSWESSGSMTFSATSGYIYAVAVGGITGDNSTTITVTGGTLLGAYTAKKSDYSNHGADKPGVVLGIIKATSSSVTVRTNRVWPYVGGGVVMRVAI